MTRHGTHVLRAGVRRGLIEFRNMVQTPSEFGYTLFGFAAVIVVVWFLRDVRVDGVDAPLMQFAFPGMLAMQILLVGTYSTASVLSAEREDGTLLRAKSVPNGTTVWLIGLIVRILIEILLGIAIVAVPILVMVPEVWAAGLPMLGIVIAYVLVGIFALVPLGLVVGAAVRNARAVASWGLFFAVGLIALSGVFAPLEVYPAWLQIIAQVFPLYWLGLGLRSAMLPEGLQMAEIGDSWRVIETLGVLGLWAIVGLALAPALLRRAARRESGSALQQRREVASQRV